MQPKNGLHFFLAVADFEVVALTGVLVAAGLAEAAAAALDGVEAAGFALGVAAALAVVVVVAFAEGATAGGLVVVVATLALAGAAGAAAAFAAAGGSADNSKTTALVCPAVAVKATAFETNPVREALHSWLPGSSVTSSVICVTFLPSQTTHSHASGWHVKRALAGPVATLGVGVGTTTAAGAATAEGVALGAAATGSAFFPSTAYPAIARPERSTTPRPIMSGKARLFLRGAIAGSSAEETSVGAGLGCPGAGAAATAAIAAVVIDAVGARPSDEGDGSG